MIFRFSFLKKQIFLIVILLLVLVLTACEPPDWQVAEKVKEKKDYTSIQNPQTQSNLSQPLNAAMSKEGLSTKTDAKNPSPALPDSKTPDLKNPDINIPASQIQDAKNPNDDLSVDRQESKSEVASPKNKPDIPRVYDVVIIGGGISGLTAAHYLRDLDIIVLEKESSPGGQIRSGSKSDFRFTIGPQVFQKPSGDFASLLNDLKLSPIETDSQILFKSKLFLSIPEALNDATTDRLSTFAIRVAGIDEEFRFPPDFNKNSAMATYDKMTLRETLDQWNVPQMYHVLYDNLAERLMGATEDEVSSLAMMEYIAADFNPGFSVDVLGSQDSSYIAPKKYTFETGPSAITSALAKELGSKVKTKSTVSSIRRSSKPKVYTIEYTDAETNPQFIESKSVILATNADSASRIASSVLSQEVIGILDNIEYCPYTIVLLHTTSPLYPDANMLIAPGLFFSYIFDLTKHQRDASPNPPKVFLSAVYIPPNRCSDLPPKNDDELLKEMYKDLDRIRSNSKEIVTKAEIIKIEKAIPLIPRNGLAARQKLSELDTDNVFLAGDYLIFPSITEASNSGRLAAQKARQAIE